MHVLELKFKLIGAKQTESQVDAIIGLLGSLRLNYQILADDMPIAEQEDGYSVFVNSPDHDALNEQYHNKYVRENLEKLTSLGLELNVILRGKDPNSSPVCTCENHSDGYILYTNFLMTESSLRCFRCFNVVPIYKTPKTHGEDYYDIHTWYKDYQAFDYLQISYVGETEKHSLHQLSDLNSPLTKRGLSICNKFEELTGSKTYYYLFQAYGESSESELERKCPSCGSEWHREQPLHKLFDFVCDKCNLLSNIASSIGGPDDEYGEDS